jgi:hypothetical protein
MENNALSLVNAFFASKKIEPTPSKIITNFEKGKGFLEMEELGLSLKERPFSYSSIKSFHNGRYGTRFQIFEYWTAQRSETPKTIFEVGNSIEAYICMPEAEKEILSKYFVYENRITNAIRDEASLLGKTPMLKGEFDKLQGMITALKNNDRAQSYLSQLWESPNLEFQPEVLFNFDNLPHLPFILKPDCNWTDTNGRKIGTDFKSTESLSGFQELLWKKLHYWIQASVYDAHYQYDEFHFFVVQRQVPYLWHVFKFDREALDRLAKKLRSEVIAPLTYCLEFGFYDQYVKLPEWL